MQTRCQGKLGFTYTIDHIRGGKLLSRDIHANLIPDEGLNYIVDTTTGAASIANWYIGIYSGDYTPQATDTASNILSRATEFTAYSETTRGLFVKGAVTEGGVDNFDAPAEFTITGPGTIYGAFIISSANKGDATGKLLSVVRTSPARPVIAGDTFSVRAGLQLISA